MYTIVPYGPRRTKKAIARDIIAERGIAAGAKETAAERKEARQEKAAAKKAKSDRHP